MLCEHNTNTPCKFIFTYSRVCRVLGRAVDAMLSTSVHHQQNGDDDGGSVTSGDKQDGFSTTEERSNYENMMEQDYDEEMTDLETEEDENENDSEIINCVSEDNTSSDITMATTTVTPTTATILNQPPKRNKRKNFEPRNISLYAGEDNDAGDKTCQVEDGVECDSDIDMEADENEYDNDRLLHKPLDLSENSIPPSSPQLQVGSNTNGKRRRKPVIAPQRRVNQSNVSSGLVMGAPIDLSCSRSAHSENNDESCGEEGDEQNNSDSGSGGGDDQAAETRGDNRHHHRNVLHISNNTNPPEGHALANERLYHQRHYIDSNGTSYHHLNNHHNQQSLRGDRIRYSPNSQHRSNDTRQQCSPLSSLQQAAQSLGFHHHFPPGLTAEQLTHYHHHHHPQQGTDASAMKEYAENTMKELLSIYGLNSPDMAETITKNVPIANFSSGEYSYHIVIAVNRLPPGATKEF